MLFTTSYPTPYHMPTTDLRKVSISYHLNHETKELKYSRERMFSFLRDQPSVHNRIKSKQELVDALIENPASIIPEDETLFVRAMTLRDLFFNPVCSVNHSGEMFFPEEYFGDESANAAIYEFIQMWKDNPTFSQEIRMAFPDYFEVEN